VPLLIVDDLGMRKLPHTAAEDLLEIIMRRYERAATLLTSNRPVDDWGKLLGDTAAVTRAPRSLAPSRPRAQMRAAQLAHQNPDRLAP
jgi:DNA replication protein DnaC